MYKLPKWSLSKDKSFSEIVAPLTRVMAELGELKTSAVSKIEENNSLMADIQSENLDLAADAQQAEKTMKNIEKLLG